ncbi:mitochondrial carrier domain-containing protein [Aspergillus recurvatus]
MEKTRKAQQGSSPGVTVRLLAGGIAGASETMITYPFELVKTLRQLPKSSVSLQPSSFSLLRSTISTRGIPGLYAGCTALATSNALKASVRFFAFFSSKEWFKSLETFNENTATLLAGVTAGTAESILVVTPAESLKTRMIEANKRGAKFSNPGIARMVKEILEKDGAGAFWRGTTPVIGKQAVNSGVRFTTFGILQGEVARRWPEGAGTVGTTLAIGAVSGIATVYASMPFDNIKTRIQSAGHVHNGMLDCAADIARRDGIRAFWRGTTPRLMRLILSSGITFTVYEQIVQFVS